MTDKPKDSKAFPVAKQVTGNKADGYDFNCPVTDGSCGTRGEDPNTPFHSDGWPTRELAELRGLQHYAEHRGEGAMPDLDEFRSAAGLQVKDGRAVVRTEDL